MPMYQTDGTIHYCVPYGDSLDTGPPIDKSIDLTTMVQKPLTPPIMENKPRINRDRELIDRVKNRDKPAFGEIYSRFSQIVFNLVYRILKDREEAEEVVQEIFLLVWRKAASYDSEKGALSTWIINIARNRSIDRLRALGHRDRGIQVDEERLNSKYDLSRMIEDREERKKIIQKALESLPEDQRVAIETVYFDGFTHVEAAERLNEPVGTIKTRLRLGVAKLREKIKPYFQDLS